MPIAPLLDPVAAFKFGSIGTAVVEENMWGLFLRFAQKTTPTITPRHVDSQRAVRFSLSREQEYAIINGLPFELKFSCKGKPIPVRNPPRASNQAKYAIPVIVLAVLVVYTYAIFLRAPYLGFLFLSTDGTIQRIYVAPPEGPSLQVGDQIVQVGAVSFESYQTDLQQPLVDQAPKGQEVEIAVRRNGNPITIPWVMPGINPGEFVGRLSNQWWIAYFFWFFGALAALLVRPEDERKRLLVALNFLTAVWLIAGTLSTWSLWLSPLVMRAAIWLCVPVYLHFHWIFPRPVKRLSPGVKIGVYGCFGFLSIAEFLRLLPNSAYLLGLLLALVGSIVFLILNAVRHPLLRKDISIVALGFAASVLPPLGIGLAVLLGKLQYGGLIGFLTLPALPGAYFYAIYRRQLGGMELRANRAIIVFLFAVVLFTVSLVAIPAVSALFPSREGTILAATLVCLAFCLLSSRIYPGFERWAEHRLLGMPLPPTRLLDVYTTQITTGLDRQNLIQLLRDEILPSLLVRQAMLLRLEDAGEPGLLFRLGKDDFPLPRSNEVTQLIAGSGKQRLALAQGGNLEPCPWVILCLPLKVDQKTIGVLLLGRRDPDDTYAATEIPTLQSLMNQTALALINIEQAERLLALSQANIERWEAERSHLARELHDDVLGQLAVLSLAAVDVDPNPELELAYQKTVTHLRGIIKGLRPAMLTYGLRAAVDELVDELLDQADPRPRILVELEPGDLRYPAEVELHVYRIVQEACRNALKYAKARQICIQGTLEPDRMELVVQDDGMGFTTGSRLDLEGLLRNQHFGLAGMHERAASIGARVQILSSLGQGTQVQVTWENGRLHSL